MQDASRHVDLQAAAAATMRAHGFEPEFSPQVAERAGRARRRTRRPTGPGDGIRDLRESAVVVDRQRHVAGSRSARGRRALPDGATRIQVAIADVDAFVRQGSADRRPRGARDHDGLYGRPELSDAARGTLDARDLAARSGRTSSASSSNSSWRRTARCDRATSIARSSATRPSSPTTASARGSRAGARRRPRWRRRRSCRPSCGSRTRARSRCGRRDTATAR